MKVAVLGCGHVGLVTGLALALIGHRVGFMDIDRTRLAALREGRIPFREPGLEEALGLVRDRVSFRAELRRVLRGREVVFIAVDTPVPSAEAGGFEASHFHEAVCALARDWPAPATPPRPLTASSPPPAGRVISPIVVVKSTVPPGTTRATAGWLGRLRPDVDWQVASNPEFLRQGTALSDALRPSRLVIGTDSAPARSRLTRLYRGLVEGRFAWPPFVPPVSPSLRKGPVPVLWTTPESAELAKLAANAFLAARISMINELADICERVGADIGEVARAVGLDDRLGPGYLEAGWGFGGSCLPKDLVLLAQAALAAGCRPLLVQAVAEVNESQPGRLLARLESLLGGAGLSGTTVAVLGLAFKPGTDDVRGSVSLAALRHLVTAGAAVRVHDPMVDPATLGGRGGEGDLFSRVQPCASVEQAVSGADAVILATPWPDYVAADWGHLAGRLRRPILVDARNAMTPERAREAGLTYLGVGRPAASAAGLPSGP